MSKRSTIKEIQRLSQQRQQPINWDSVRELRAQIEIDMVNAVTEGYLTEQGVFLAYRDEHLPELPHAAKLYQQEEPEDMIRYLGLDPDDGKYTIQIIPSSKWLKQIKPLIPNPGSRAVSSSVPD